MPSISPHSHWGWTSAVRGVLIVLAASGTLALLTLAPRDEPPAELPSGLVLDPNTARPEVLGALPKVGPALVARILEAREESPFRSVDELEGRVRGIGPATLETLRPYLRIDTVEGEREPASGPTPPGETPNEG
ncbi:ComEA family DNA-binding protein [Singulisphaera sp. PoT]|uniref:ComEA family DNA-binding protein n=1 Tax=Singulisphaera sp. PoT TaxID=3411797 RepID=UPI003BF51BF6